MPKNIAKKKINNNLVAGWRVEDDVVRMMGVDCSRECESFNATQPSALCKSECLFIMLQTWKWDVGCEMESMACGC